MREHRFGRGVFVERLLTESHTEPRSELRRRTEPPSHQPRPLLDDLCVREGAVWEVPLSRMRGERGTCSDGAHLAWSEGPFVALSPAPSMLVLNLPLTHLRPLSHLRPKCATEMRELPSIRMPDCFMCSVKPNRRSRSLASRARLRAPVLSPHRKKMRPTKHAIELVTEAVTAAARFCSCVHWSAPRKRSTQQARSRTYVSSECVSCRCG